MDVTLRTRPYLYVHSPTQHSGKPIKSQRDESSGERRHGENDQQNRRKKKMHSEQQKIKNREEPKPFNIKHFKKLYSHK